MCLLSLKMKSLCSSLEMLKVRIADATSLSTFLNEQFLVFLYTRSCSRFSSLIKSSVVFKVMVAFLLFTGDIMLFSFLRKSLMAWSFFLIRSSFIGLAVYNTCSVLYDFLNRFFYLIVSYLLSLSIWDLLRLYTVIRKLYPLFY